MTFQMIEAFRELRERGFEATQLYGDDVIRMSKPVARDCWWGQDEVVAWVGTEGMVRPPALWSDYRAATARRV